MLLDLLIQCGSILVLYLLLMWQFPTEVAEIRLQVVVVNVALMVSCVFLFQLLLRTYDSLWRYAESWEYLLLLGGQALGLGLYTLINLVVFKRSLPAFFILSVGMTSLIGMLLMRFVYRLYRKRAAGVVRNGKIHVAIVGAGDGGVTLLNEMRGNPWSRYTPYCFFDDDVEKRGKFIHGVEIFGPIACISERLKDVSALEIIIAIPSLSEERRREIITLCARLKCVVKILPGTLSMVNDVNLTAQIRPVRIEDLLGRPLVDLDSAAVREMLEGKTVLVTGGGGSIGSEICRQVAKRRPGRLVVLDIYENNAYDLQQELRREYGEALELFIEIASVRDFKRICTVMEQHRPDYVFHAAAHKHVPLMEDCPAEAIKNNVFGTYNTARAAALAHVEKFVLISTDKAVNPTNVMGASKRLCEMVIQGMDGGSGTEFCAVRFGNVLGSNGSVVPLFQRQIAQGGPVTITDKRVIRYFMSIPEATQLVLQAGAMAHSGEVFVLDMGLPVKILDLAENLIRLSGHWPYVDIAIEEIGLRPGEKLFEELLLKSEELEKTANNKIYVEHQPLISALQINQDLNELRAVLDWEDQEALIELLRKMVPTFRKPEEVNQRAAVRIEELERDEVHREAEVAVRV